MIRLTTSSAVCTETLRAALPLYGTAATRAIEQTAAAALPPHALMQRAGLAVARLALALAPHARQVWIACGAGNNGGDGLEAAMHLHRWGRPVTVSWLSAPDHSPPDARAAWQRARNAGVPFVDEPPALAEGDLAIDALLGIGMRSARSADTGHDHPTHHTLTRWMQHLGNGLHTLLCVDLPSGLSADTGQPPDGAQATRPWWHAHPADRRHTLSLLSLKPGLFTAHGRDACGWIWYDDLGIAPHAQATPTAWLNAAPERRARPHASHKGSHGDVAVVGGAPGMRGATVLAAQAALQAGAGRVYLQWLDAPENVAADSGMPAMPATPAFPAMPAFPADLMTRPWTGHAAADTVACGCGGGDAVRHALPALLSRTPRLVLDADALNAIAQDTSLQALLTARAQRAGHCTVLTPHPLEAARLLGCDAGAVQADRLHAASQLAQRFAACVLLKGSGTVIAAPGQVPRINPTGNARLAIAGTGDVLAGLIAARLAQRPDTPGRSADSSDASAHDAVHEAAYDAAYDAAFHAACAAAWEHGLAGEANANSDHTTGLPTLTASALAQQLQAPDAA